MRRVSGVEGCAHCQVATNLNIKTHEPAFMFDGPQYLDTVVLKVLKTHLDQGYIP